MVHTTCTYIYGGALAHVLQTRDGPVRSPLNDRLSLLLFSSSTLCFDADDVDERSQHNDNESSSPPPLEVGVERNDPLQFSSASHMLVRRDADDVNERPDSESERADEKLRNAAADLALVSLRRVKPREPDAADEDREEERREPGHRLLGARN